MTSKTDGYVAGIVQELRQMSSETEWAEFKENLADPEQVGEYISALSNAAALARKRKGYLVWGIEDGTHAVVGTSFSPSTATKGDEQLENWILRLLEPKIDFQFHELTVDGQPVVLLEVERAFRHPVKFKGQEFIRVKSYKQKLKRHPQKERALWRVFDETPFEARLAQERIDESNVLQLLDYPAYFDLLELPLPEGRSDILEALKEDELIQINDAGSWDITNLGAILFAKDLSQFRGLRRKALRIIEHDGATRIQTRREFQSQKGYASGFESAIEYINGHLPSNEMIGQALRKDVPMYPELAIRELVANALIHQDFFVTGAGPMVEIFADRVEITNPGTLLCRRGQRD
jgi:predicted HTH transcriptional regulator